LRKHNLHLGIFEQPVVEAAGEVEGEYPSLWRNLLVAISSDWDKLSRKEDLLQITRLELRELC
jgi:hypothetical protein